MCNSVRVCACVSVHVGSGGGSYMSADVCVCHVPLCFMVCASVCVCCMERVVVVVVT